jgi:hypothetical protein
MSGLDESWRVRIVAERLADFADGRLEHTVADEHTGPDRVEQFLLRDEPAGVMREVREECKGLRRERDGHIRVVQVAADEIKPKTGKCQDSLGFHGAHRSAESGGHCTPEPETGGVLMDS